MKRQASLAAALLAVSLSCSAAQRPQTDDEFGKTVGQVLSDVRQARGNTPLLVAAPAPGPAGRLHVDCRAFIRRAYSTLAAAQASKHFSGDAREGNLGVDSREEFVKSIEPEADPEISKINAAVSTYYSSFTFALEGQFIYTTLEYYEGPDGQRLQLYAELVREKPDGSRIVLVINEADERKKFEAGSEIKTALRGVEWRTALYNIDKTKPMNTSEWIKEGLLPEGSVLNAEVSCKRI